MAVEVSDYEIHNLTNPVIITFRKSKADKSKKEKFSCVFWDFNIGGKTFAHLIEFSYFTIHNPTIHGPTIPDLCVNCAFLCIP